MGKEYTPCEFVARIFVSPSRGVSRPRRKKPTAAIYAEVGSGPTGW